MEWETAFYPEQNATYPVQTSLSSGSMTQGSVLLEYRLFLAFVLFVVLSGGFFLNLTTILTFFRRRQLRLDRNYLVCNLAVCDFFLSCIPLFILFLSLLFQRWVGAERGCQAYMCSFLLFGTAGLNSMAAIAFER